jgi:putative NADH-flavin reductase
VRSPEKLPDDLKSNRAVIVIQGQLEDNDQLSKAMEGVDVVLSALGPSVKRGPFHPPDKPIARGYSHIIDLMHQHGVKRLICLGTASITDPADKFSLPFSLLVKGVATFARNAYNDVVAIGETVRTAGADLDWTIVRVPILRDTQTSDVIAGYVGDGKTNTTLTKLGFAVFVLGEVEKREWVKKAPLICSA